MRLPKWPPRDNEAISTTIESLLTAFTVILLLASLGGVAALLASVHIGVRVGDILVFKPGIGLADSLPVTVTRAQPLRWQSASAATCGLDPAVMARDGGSLVVEAQSLTKPVYRVHWAGGRTSIGTADCGSAADLTVSRMDLQMLVDAVGGFSLNSAGNVL